jgi:hypothetical protein
MAARSIAPGPRPTARRSTRLRIGARSRGAQEFFEEWQIEDEPGEIAIELDGDVGLVPLGGDDS